MWNGAGGSGLYLDYCFQMDGHQSVESRFTLPVMNRSHAVHLYCVFHVPLYMYIHMCVVVTLHILSLPSLLLHLPQGLFRKVVLKQLSPRELVRMSSEKLASEELSQWREQTIKKVGCTSSWTTASRKDIVTFTDRYRIVPKF